MKVQEWLPVVLSVLIIVMVAVLEKQSKAVAAVTATMPLTIPLAIWIVHASSKGERGELIGFTLYLFLGILPTVAFVLAAWLTARSGAKAGWNHPGGLCHLGCGCGGAVRSTQVPRLALTGYLYGNTLPD